MSSILADMVRDEKFTHAFLLFVSECERYDLRVKGIELEEILPPLVESSATLYGIPIKIKEVRV